MSSPPPARPLRRWAPWAVLALVTVVLSAVVVRELVGRGDVDLVEYAVPAFPLAFAEVPDGVAGPALSLETGTAYADWSDPQDPTSGIGISVRADRPADDGEPVGRVTVDGATATVSRIPITGIGTDFAVVWERREGQWVTVFGSGRFGTRDTAVALARQVVDRPIAAPLQLAVAPRGWEVVAYADDRSLTLADPSDGSSTLRLSFPDPAGPPASTGGGATELTVHGRPATLASTGGGWHLQAALPDGTGFVLQAPARLTAEQVAELAEGVSRERR